LKIGNQEKDTNYSKLIKMANYTVNTNLYFEAFNNKSIQKLSQLYSPTIRLVDWDIDISGREEVLNANSELFNLDFELKVNKTYQINNKTFNEITITIGEDVLEIMDVITFNKEFQIENITAYKR
tara:strand:+ start:885 stop:1259 length:375 start_codon:yes stop_codon:yes gene_type:complete